MQTAFDAEDGSHAHTVVEASEFSWDGHTLEPGIGIALSGGGFRAMLFHAGALLRLNELGILSQAARISSVSGGSIASGFLAKVWSTLAKDPNGVFTNLRANFVEPIVVFSKSRIDVVDSLTGLLPWTSAAEEVAKSYEDFVGAGTLQSLPDTPRFVFCATNLQTGVLWRFSKPYAGDYVVGRIDAPTFKLAQAIAASSAFPPVLSPLVLKVAASTIRDWPNAPPRSSEISDFRERVILSDGGVYDNHGIEPIVKRFMTVFVSDGGAPFRRTAEVAMDWISQLRRVLDVTDNQVRALRRRDLIARLKGGNDAHRTGNLGSGQVRARDRMGAYWSIDTDPRKLTLADGLECSLTLRDKLSQLPTRLSTPGEVDSKQLVNWGYAICDRSVRVNYSGPTTLLPVPPKWPYDQTPMM